MPVATALVDIVQTIEWIEGLLLVPTSFVFHSFGDLLIPDRRVMKVPDQMQVANRFRVPCLMQPLLQILHQPTDQQHEVVSLNE